MSLPRLSPSTHYNRLLFFDSGLVLSFFRYAEFGAVGEHLTTRGLALRVMISWSGLLYLEGTHCVLLHLFVRVVLTGLRANLYALVGLTMRNKWIVF
jgi:hypothetical protein